MADRKISELTALTTPATGDLIPIVDISEVAAADKNKSITVGELLRGAPDGTAAAPGFAFESDGGNGMFLGGTDILAFSTGGTQAVTIDASQRVGLGNSSPGSYFNEADNLVVGSTGSNGITFVSGTTGNGRIHFADGTSGSDAYRGFLTYNHSTDLMSIGTAGQTALSIDGSGNFGIGTASASFKTEIVDTLQADSNLHYSLVVRGDDSGTDGESAQIFLSAINVTSRGAAIAAVRKTGSNDHDLVFKTSAASATPSEKVRITSDGKLGLGTSSPSSRLTVVDSSSNTAGAAGAFIDINNTDTTASVVSGLRFKNGPTDAYKGAIYFKDTAGDARGDLVFATNDVDSGATNVGLSDARMTITRTGNVGIGTTSPSEKLHLADSGAYSKIRIAGNSTSAYTEIYGDNVGNLIFNADPGNSGSSSTIRFTVDGPERARIDSSGRLGVGTSTPGSYDSNANNLVVANTSGNAGISIIGSTTGNSSLYFGDGTGTSTFRGYIDYLHNTDALRFGTAATERMRIGANTQIQMTTPNSSIGSLYVNASSTGFASTVLEVLSSRAASSAYNLIAAYSGAGSDKEFNVRGDGQVTADGSFTGGGADYAEFFEWSDGNTIAEDRRGISVVLDGDKIREAVAGEEPIGVISGNPSVVGDAAWNKWNGKYLRDDFGTYIQEDYEVEDEDGNNVTQQRRKLNPDYDPDVEYVNRENRPEWDCVGLMGKLRIRKGQVTGARWIKMRDISDSVEEWLVR